MSYLLRMTAFRRLLVVDAIGNTSAWPEKLSTSPMAHFGPNRNRIGKGESSPSSKRQRMSG